MSDESISAKTFVAFDIETSGSHPLESEICEIAAVKFQNNKIIDEYQALAKTKKPMSDFIISIHGITNEMLANEKPISDKIHEFYDFIKGSYCIAHHSPFDMGFIAIEFEKKLLNPPVLPALCTSLLSRKLFPESTNHKLQTLVEFFKLEKNQAHRALSDAKSCLGVMIKCFDKIGWDKSIEDVIKIQGKPILWQNFYLSELKKKTHIAYLIEAIEKGLSARIILRFGRGTIDEVVNPNGLVRSPDGDFMFAHSTKENKIRRYYLDKILESEIIQKLF